MYLPLFTVYNLRSNTDASRRAQAPRSIRSAPSATDSEVGRRAAPAALRRRARGASRAACARRPPRRRRARRRRSPAGPRVRRAARRRGRPRARVREAAPRQARPAARPRARARAGAASARRLLGRQLARLSHEPASSSSPRGAGSPAPTPRICSSSLAERACAWRSPPARRRSSTLCTGRSWRAAVSSRHCTSARATGRDDGLSPRTRGSRAKIVSRSRSSLERASALALLARPLESPEAVQAPLELGGELEQVLDVLARILDSCSARQRAASQRVKLALLATRTPSSVAEQRLIGGLRAQPGEAGGDLRVEHVRHLCREHAAHERDVLAPGVHDDLHRRVGEHRRERGRRRSPRRAGRAARSAAPARRARRRRRRAASGTAASGSAPRR